MCTAANFQYVKNLYPTSNSSAFSTSTLLPTSLLLHAFPTSPVSNQTFRQLHFVFFTCLSTTNIQKNFLLSIQNSKSISELIFLLLKTFKQPTVIFPLPFSSVSIFSESNSISLYAKNMLKSYYSVYQLLIFGAQAILSQ